MTEQQKIQVTLRRKKVMKVVNGKLVEDSPALAVEPQSKPEAKAESVGKVEQPKSQASGKDSQQPKAKKPPRAPSWKRDTEKATYRVGLLRELFPDTFCQPPRPLSRTIRQQIAASLKASGRKDGFFVHRKLPKCLYAWVSQKAYLEAMIEPDSQRWTLDGESEELAKAHRDHARGRLKDGDFWEAP